MFRNTLMFFLLILICAIVIVFYVNIREVIGKPKINDDALDGALARFQSRVRADLDDGLQRARRDLGGVGDNEAMRKLVNTDLAPQFHMLKAQLDGTGASMKTLDKDFQDFMKKIHDEMSTLKLNITDKLLNRLDDVKTQLLEPNNKLSENLDIIKTHILEPNTEMLGNLQLLKVKLDNLQKNPNVDLITTLDDLRAKISHASSVVDQLNALRDLSASKFTELQTQLEKALASDKPTLNECLKNQQKFTLESLDRLHERLVGEKDRALNELTRALNAQNEQILKLNEIEIKQADTIASLRKEADDNHHALTSILDNNHTIILDSQTRENQELRKAIEHDQTKHNALFVKHLDDSLTNHDTIITKHMDNSLTKQNENIVKYIDDSLNVPMKSMNDRFKEYNEKLGKIVRDTINSDRDAVNDDHDNIMARLMEVNGAIKLLPTTLEARLMLNKQLLTTDNINGELINPIMDKIGVSLAKTTMDQSSANRLIVEPLKHSIVASTTSQLAPIRNDIIDRLDETRDAIKSHLDSSGDDMKLRIKSNADVMATVQERLSEVATASKTTLSRLEDDALVKNVAEQVSKSNVSDIYEPLNKTIVNLPKTLNVDFTPLLSDIKNGVLKPLNDELQDGLIKRLDGSIKQPIIDELREPMSKRIRKETQNITKSIVDPIVNNLGGDSMIERISERVVGSVGKSIWSDTKRIDAALIKPLRTTMQNDVTKPLIHELDSPMIKRIKSSVTDPLMRELNEPMVKRIKTTIGPIISSAVDNDVKGVVNKAVELVNINLRDQSTVNSEQLKMLLKHIDELPKHIIIPDSIQKSVDLIHNKQIADSTEIERIALLVRQLREYCTTASAETNKQTKALIDSLREKTERLADGIETAMRKNELTAGKKQHADLG